MKSNRKVVRFDYSKYGSIKSWQSEHLFDYEFWGLHPKNGKLRIDTKRYKKSCEGLGITEFLPKDLFKQRNTVYFSPKKIRRNDYKVNIFRGLMELLKRDWQNEYKPILEMIKTPKQVMEESRLNELMYTSDSEDYDEINTNAFMNGMRRERQYMKILQISVVNCSKK